MSDQLLSRVNPAPPGSWPLRLSMLPLRALKIGPRLLDHLATTGFHTVGDVVQLNADQLSQTASLRLPSAQLVIAALQEIAQGSRDPTSSEACTLEEELDEIVARTRIQDTDRVVTILERLYGLPGTSSSTLEAIGMDLGVTRERVRQIRCRVDDEICAVLRWYNAKSLAAARECVCRHGGLASVSEVALAVSNRISAGRYDSQAYIKWIIEQANDPTLIVINGCIIVGPPLGIDGFQRLITVTETLLSEHMLLTPSFAANRIAETLGEVQQTHSEHYASHMLSMIGYAVLPGQFSAHPWSRADWAEYVLKRNGSAMHYSAIAARVQDLAGIASSAAGFNTVLNTDERFVRVGAGDFVLASTGVERYGRFDEVIERYLRNATVPVHEDQITDDLLKSYTVTRSTISAMLRLNGSCFLHYGGGYWGLADVRYLPDPLLEREIVRCLVGTGQPLSVVQIRHWLLADTQGTLCPPTVSLELTLYLSQKVRRFGTNSPTRFQLENLRVQMDTVEQKAVKEDVENSPPTDSIHRLRAIADLL